MNNRKTIYIIINPKSGTSSKGNLPIRIAEKIDATKFTVHFFITGYAGHGNEIAQEAVKNKVDYVIAVGGDGTVNEVGRALVHSDTALGIIPLGSGNGLGRDLKIPTNLEGALDVILEENIEAIDYGKANGKVFFCTCGMGFDAEVAHRVAGKKQRGQLMYFTQMLETYFDQKPQEYEIICPEGTIKSDAFVVTCANASQYGYDAHIAPHADIKDGKMNIAILRPLSLIDLPKTSIQLFTRKIDENKKMEELMTERALIKRERDGAIHLDGDAMPAGKEIEVEIISSGLKVLVPSKPKVRSKYDPQEIFLSVLRAIS